MKSTMIFNLALLTLAVIATAHADSSVDFGSQLRYSSLLRNGRSLQDLPNRFNEKSLEVPCDFAALEMKLEQAERDIKERIEQAKKGMAVSEPIFICQKDVGRSGLIISTPGYYRLKENIEFNPNADFLAAITIQSSNVTLDLNGKTVSESGIGFATFDATQGIVIASGSNFVTVKNGKVKGFSDNGILAASINAIPLPSEHVGIVFANLKVTKCGKLNTANSARVFSQRNGIGIDGGTSVLIDRCCASHIASFIEADAIGGYFVNDILIKDCKTSYAAIPGTSTSSLSSGIVLEVFSNGIIDSCSATNITGYFSIGIGFDVGDTLIVRNCKGDSNEGAHICLGISPQQLSNALITHCETSDNLAANIDPTQGYVQVLGLLSLDNSNVIIKDCVAHRNAIISNSIPSVSPRTMSTGFLIDASNSVLTENCSSSENFVSPGVPAFSLNGFGVLATCSDVILRRCFAQNHSSGDDSLVVAGFLVGLTAGAAQETIVLDECVAKRNVNTTNPANGFGVLFGFNGFSETIINSEIRNCTSKCNNIGFEVTGITTTGNLIQGNTALNNSLFGFLDTSCDSNSYFDNCSCNPKATGICSSLTCSAVPLSGNANFCGLPAGTPPQKEGHCKS